MDLRLKHVLLPGLGALCTRSAGTHTGLPEGHSDSHLAKVPCLWQAWDPRMGRVEGTTGKIPSAGLLLWYHESSLRYPYLPRNTYSETFHLLFSPRRVRVNHKSKQTRQTLNLPDPPRAVPKPPHMPAAREVGTASGHLSHALACPPSLLVLNPHSSVFHVPNVAEQTCWARHCSSLSPPWGGVCKRQWMNNSQDRGRLRW